MIIRLADRRPLATLITLLLLQGALLSYQVRSQDGRRLIHSGSLMVLAPIAAVVNALVSGVSDGAEGAQGLWQAHLENTRLEDENARLRLEIARLRQLDSLLPRLEAYQPLRRLFEAQMVLGSVFWNSPDQFQRRILVNVGGRDGVRQDDAVVSPLGIVGRVRQTTVFGSSVELVTNPGASAGAMVGPLRWQGIISGDGSPLLRLDFISNAKSVKIGDAVLASGTERIYPKDFPIGEVVQCEPGPMGQLLIRVRPAADLARLEEVAVILRSEQRILRRQDP